jgi:hypothetical protein
MVQRDADQGSELLKAFRAVYEEGNRAWNEGDFKRAYGGLTDDRRAAMEAAGAEEPSERGT